MHSDVDCIMRSLALQHAQFINSGSVYDFVWWPCSAGIKVCPLVSQRTSHWCVLLFLSATDCFIRALQTRADVCRVRVKNAVVDGNGDVAFADYHRSWLLKLLRVCSFSLPFPQGWIMVPPGPEAWKRLRAPRTLYLQYWPYLSSLLRNVVYVKTTIFAQLSSKQRIWNALCVKRGLLHLKINIVYSKVLPVQALSIILTNHCDMSKQVITIWSKQWHG